MSDEPIVISAQSYWNDLFDDDEDEVQTKDKDFEQISQKLRSKYKALNDEKKKRKIKVIEAVNVPYIPTTKKHQLFRQREVERKKARKSEPAATIKTPPDSPRKGDILTISIDQGERNMDKLLNQALALRDKLSRQRQ
jgi:hypothetical protein